MTGQATLAWPFYFLMADFRHRRRLDEKETLQN
jgi:hypothetical protein